jgi:hypothetical protein
MVRSTGPGVADPRWSPPRRSRPPRSLRSRPQRRPRPFTAVCTYSALLALLSRFFFFFTSINIFCFQQVMSPQSPSPTYHHPALYMLAASSLSRFAQTPHAPPYNPKYCVLLTATYRFLRITLCLDSETPPNRTAKRRFTQATICRNYFYIA